MVTQNESFPRETAPASQETRIGARIVVAVWACQECGRRFKTTKAAERATTNGCPGCGGTDIDLSETIRGGF